MKKNYSILTALLTLALGGNAQTTSVETASWVALTSGTTATLTDVCATSASTCYFVGFSGTIKKTTDGGSTWTAEVSGTTQSLYSIRFTSATTGYAVGNANTALKTTDGGATWTQMTLPSVTLDCRAVYFLDANNGYIIGGVTGSPAVILKTTNAGSSWTSLNTSAVSTDAAYGIAFTSATDGYVTDFDGHIIKTTNGGTTWTSLTSGTTNPLYTIYFTGVNTGIVTSNAGDIRTTSNAGTAWSGVVSGTTNALTGMDFYDASNGFTVGGNVSANTSIILSTTDGGATWSSYLPGTQRLYGVDMYSPNLGYAVGLGGTVLKYTSNVDVHEYSSAALSLNSYPNPFSTSTTIDCGTYVFKDKALVEVYDIAGKLVKSTQATVKANTIVTERDNLENGIYLFKVYDGKILIGTGKMIAE